MSSRRRGASDRCATVPTTGFYRDRETCTTLPWRRVLFPVITDGSPLVGLASAFHRPRCERIRRQLGDKCQKFDHLPRVACQRSAEPCEIRIRTTVQESHDELHYGGGAQ